MKIAVFHELPPGGARIAVNEIAKRLGKKHQIDLYYVDEKKNLHENKYYSQVYFFKFVAKFWKGNNWKIKLYKDTVELYKLFLLNKKISEIIRGRSYDLLFVNASKFIESPFLLRFPNVRKVFYLHDPHDRALYETAIYKKRKLDPLRTTYEKIITAVRKMIDKKNLDGADFFLANSKFTQKIFKKTYGKESNLTYLAVDTTFFSPIEARKEFDVMYIGSHEPIDGYSLLEDSLRFIPKQVKIKSVFFEDEWLSVHQMRDLYRKSKIVLALGKREPFGLIPLEAMACGVPVIAVDEGGYQETLVDKKTGFLITKNPKILAEKITYLLSHENARNEMGKNARKHVQNFWTWKKSIDHLETAISLQARVTEK